MRGEENPEVDEAGCGVGLGEEHVAVEDVVGDVGDEEDAGDDEGSEHAVAVGDDLAAANVAEAEDEEDGAECVEDCVERGEEGEMRAGDVDGRMVVDEPGEEERGDGADAMMAAMTDGGVRRFGAGKSRLHVCQKRSRPLASRIMASISSGR